MSKAYTLPALPESKINARASDAATAATVKTILAACHEGRALLEVTGRFAAVLSFEQISAKSGRTEAFEVRVYETDDHTGKSSLGYIGRERLTIDRKDLDEVTFLTAARATLHAFANL